MKSELKKCNQICTEEVNGRAEILDVQTVGVQGDFRTYERVCIVYVDLVDYKSLAWCSNPNRQRSSAESIVWFGT